jgi:acetyl esterase/lipase
MTPSLSIGLTFGIKGTILAMMCSFAWGGISHAAEESTNETMKTRSILNLSYVSHADEVQKLDLYLPVSGDGARPLVVWIHGGAWLSGSKEGPPAKELVARGYAVASVGYRFSQRAHYPALIQDCKEAVRWLRAHAREYGIDPKRIGAWGESAGGHLAALLGTTGNIRDFDVGEHLEQSSAVQCVVNWYGPTNFLDWGGPEIPSKDSPESAIYRLLGGPVSKNRNAALRASPVHFANADSAPFLMIHGDRDPVVPLAQSRMLHEVLLKVGAKSALLTIPGAAHGGEEFHTTESMGPVIAFFDRSLAAPPTKPSVVR